MKHKLFTAAFITLLGVIAYVLIVNKHYNDTIEYIVTNDVATDGDIQWTLDQRGYRHDLFEKPTLLGILLAPIRGYSINQLNSLKASVGVTFSELVDFKYVDEFNILVKAKTAIWLTTNNTTDTILLNTGESVILKAPDDEFDVYLGTGNDDVTLFIF